MIRFALFFSLAFLSSAPVLAREPENCDTYGEATVTLTQLFDAPHYDYSQNLDGIQAIAGDMRHSIPQYHALTMGITRYEPTVEFHVPMEVITYPNGMSCAHVKNADVKIGYRSVTIFIASEIPRGSCGFEETRHHEEKHIAVNREILTKFTPLLEERFKNYLRFNGNSRVENPDYAERILNHKLEEIMTETVNQMDAENMRAQREVDTTEEYNRLSKACNGELSRIAVNYDRRR